MLKFRIFKYRSMKDVIEIKSITDLHRAVGIPDPMHPLVSVINYDDVKFNDIDTKGRKYVKSFYSVSLKKIQSGVMRYGRNSYDFQSGTLVFSSPGQVQELEKDENYFVEGWGLHFHPDLILKYNLGREIENYSFFSYSVYEALHISDSEKKILSNLGKIITDEYNRNIDKHSQRLIVSNIELLLNYCTRFYERQFYTRTNLNQDYLSKFEQLIKKYYKKGNALELGIPNIKYFADKLNLTPNYLSDLLRVETGKSTREHIHLFIVERAKNLLLNTSESISQIAFELGFDYPPHFTKIFKSKTGMTPAEYRSLN